MFVQNWYESGIAIASGVGGTSLEQDRLLPGRVCVTYLVQLNGLLTGERLAVAAQATFDAYLAPVHAYSALLLVGPSRRLVGV